MWIFSVFLWLSIVVTACADTLPAPVEHGDMSLRRLAEELTALQRFVYKRFGGDPGYKESGATPPKDPAYTMMLEKIEEISSSLSDLRNGLENLQHEVQTLKGSSHAQQEKVGSQLLEVQTRCDEAKNMVLRLEDTSYQERLGKMSANELMMHIETSGRTLTEDRLEKALKLFVTKFPEDPRTSIVYKDLVFLTYKKERYQETTFYAAEFYKKSPSSPEAPEVLLMMAFSFGKMGKTAEACTTLSKIISTYPSLSDDFKDRLAEARVSFTCLS